MALPRYRWRDFGAVGTLKFITRILDGPRALHADLTAITHQLNVLLVPTLAPVCLWCWQLQGSPLWEAPVDDIRRA